MKPWFHDRLPIFLAPAGGLALFTTAVPCSLWALPVYFAIGTCLGLWIDRRDRYSVIERLWPAMALGILWRFECLGVLYRALRQPHRKRSFWEMLY